MKRVRDPSPNIRSLEAERSRIRQAINENAGRYTQLEKDISTARTKQQKIVQAKQWTDSAVTLLIRHYEVEETEAQQQTNEFTTLAVKSAQDIAALEKQIQSLQTELSQLQETKERLVQEFDDVDIQIYTYYSQRTQLSEKEVLLEYANLAHYCYKQDGSFGPLPLHKVRQSAFNMLKAKGMIREGTQSIHIMPSEITAYLKQGILNETITKEKIIEFLGFDPDPARENRIKQNSEKVDILSQVEHYRYDKDGNLSAGTLTRLKQWFINNLGYMESQMTPDGLPKTFKEDLEQGRITPAMINAIIGFDIEKAIQQRQGLAEVSTTPAVCFTNSTSTTSLAELCSNTAGATISDPTSPTKPTPEHVRLHISSD